MRLALLDRIGNWKSTGGGAAVSALLLVVLNSFDCKLPTDWLAWLVGILPLIQGALSKD